MEYHSSSLCLQQSVFVGSTNNINGIKSSRLTMPPNSWSKMK